MARGPFSGRFANLRRSGRRRPAHAHRANQAGAVLRRTRTSRSSAPRGRGGTEIEAVTVSTLPWRFRALGDSVTAGFGYYANGGQMSAFDLPFCKPGAVVTNRCSSNSDKGPSYTGPPEWSADYGLANDTSWAAQFANDLPGGVTAPDMFQNLAVTGSAPSDWLPGGILNPQLQARSWRENPELIAFTMGANPLLTDVLLSRRRRVLRVHELGGCARGLHPAVLHAGPAGDAAAALLHGAARRTEQHDRDLPVPPDRARRRTCSPTGNSRRWPTISTPSSPPRSPTRRPPCPSRASGSSSSRPRRRPARHSPPSFRGSTSGCRPAASRGRRPTTAATRTSSTARATSPTRPRASSRSGTR